MGSTSTRRRDGPLEQALAEIPKVFRDKFINGYRDLKAAHAERRFELCGIRAGKFCEVTLRFLQEKLTGQFIPFGKKIPNFEIACRELERTPTTAGPESYRLLIPRALWFVYSLRSKRDIGHVGGDVDANESDARTAVVLVDWCFCELIRINHRMSLEEAQGLLDSIVERRVALVWDVLGKRRVLASGLSYRDQVLLLLYGSTSGVPIEDLFEWTEHSNWTDFRRRVVGSLHEERLVEYDRETETVVISPSGVKKVEDEILARWSGL